MNLKKSQSFPSDGGHPAVTTILNHVGHINCFLWCLNMMRDLFYFTAIFIMVYSPAVLAHDVSARTGDVLMGIAVFPIGWIYSVPFEKLGDG